MRSMIFDMGILSVFIRVHPRLKTFVVNPHSSDSRQEVLAALPQIG